MFSVLLRQHFSCHWFFCACLQGKGPCFVVVVVCLSLRNRQLSPTLHTLQSSTATLPSRLSRVHPLLFVFSVFIYIYVHVCALSFFFFSVYMPLTSYISYVLNMFEFFFFFYIFCSLCMCIISRIAISPSWVTAGCKKTLSLVHYPCEIKFTHSFIHVPYLCHS